MMYNVLGAPRVEEALGRGFGHRIPHRVLHPEAKVSYRFFYKIIGVEMEWKEFVPVFFQDNPDAEHHDLALMCTFGWKPQAALLEDGIGFVRKGHKRYVVSGQPAAEGCVKALW